MPVSKILQGFRQAPPPAPEAPEAAGVRAVELSEEEVKNLEPFQLKPGEDIVLEMTGTLQGNQFQVSSVKYAQGAGLGPEGAGLSPSGQPAPGRTMPVPYST